jgi:GTP-binding protein
MFQTATFRLGITDDAQLPPGKIPEFAFCGRSNVGKSSLLNALVGRHSLARISKNPGQTKQLNYYSLGGAEIEDTKIFLVDLPGYGHARVSKATRNEWDNLIGTYLKGRRQLAMVLSLVDGRHGIKENDTAFFEFLENYGVPFVVVLTKIDALKAAERPAMLKKTQDGLKKFAAAFPEVFVTSSDEKMGIEALRELILERYENLTGKQR